MSMLYSPLFLNGNGHFVIAIMRNLISYVYRNCQQVFLLFSSTFLVQVLVCQRSFFCNFSVMLHFLFLPCGFR